MDVRPPDPDRRDNNSGKSKKDQTAEKQSTQYSLSNGENVIMESHSSDTSFQLSRLKI